jgi:LAO/AO transport system kinase
MPNRQDTIAERILAGEVRSAARFISKIEDGDTAIQPVLRSLYAHGGRAAIIGLTGPPGGGKSTLTDRFISQYRSEGKRVGVLAVDPTSAFTGGSILGDRIRMSQHFTDPGVFIRSMATRGYLGGLARTTGDAVTVLDAMGFDIVIVETVGVGQAELDVAQVADTVVLVLTPGQGDDVQAAKAGIMEIADIFVVNKAKREGAEGTMRNIEEILHLKPGAGEETWRPPVLRTEAIDGEGIEEVAKGIEEHRRYLADHPETMRLRRREKARYALMEILKDKVAERFLKRTEQGEAFGAILDDIAIRKKDPYGVAETMLQDS